MSSNPLLDDITSDYEALRREKDRAKAARTVAKLFPTPSGSVANLTPQWIPSHYELHKIEETCETCGEIRVISSSIMFVETHINSPSTIRKTRIDPREYHPIDGISRRGHTDYCDAPACPDCLSDVFYGESEWEN